MGRVPINPKDFRFYRIATIEGKNIFEHEYAYVMGFGKPIPKGYMVGHINGKTSDNNPLNLILAPMYDDSYPMEMRDYYREKNHVFHEHNLENNLEFLKCHFKDVYDKLDLKNYTKDKFKYIYENKVDCDPNLDTNKVEELMKGMNKK